MPPITRVSSVQPYNNNNIFIYATVCENGIIINRIGEDDDVSHKTSYYYRYNVHTSAAVVVTANRERRNSHVKRRMAYVRVFLHIITRSSRSFAARTPLTAVSGRRFRTNPPSVFPTIRRLFKKYRDYFFFKNDKQ